MGKQLSKAGMRVNTRRQRAQAISQHQERIGQYGPTIVSAPRSIESDRTILTLKLQRDEFTMYKGRLMTLVKKEHEVIKSLLLAGKRDTAKLLLRKKKYQEYLLDESQKELNAVLGQVSDAEKLEEMKTQAEQLIEKNSQALKRIQLLLSLEHIEKILEDTQEGYGKHDEVSRIVLLASIGQQKQFDSELDSELDEILANSRGKKRRGSFMDKQGSDSALPTVIGEDEEADEDVEDTEKILNEKLEQPKENEELVDVQIKEVTSEEGSISSTKAEAGDDEVKDTESSGKPSENPLKKTETVSSSLLPSVPTEPVDDEKPLIVIQEAETV